jgi:heat shock protein HslJ
MGGVRDVVVSGVLLALAVGCAPPPAETGSAAASPPPTANAAPAMSATSLAGTTWRAAVSPAESESAAPAPTITFESLEHVSGATGCNRFSGRIAFDGERVRIGPLATTRRGCAAPLMEREKTFLGALEASRSWRRSGDVLELLDERGASVLRLAPVPPNEKTAS